MLNGPCTAPRLATMASKMAWSFAGTWSLLVMEGSRAMGVPPYGCHCERREAIPIMLGIASLRSQ